MTNWTAIFAELPLSLPREGRANAKGQFPASLDDNKVRNHVIDHVSWWNERCTLITLADD